MYGESYDASARTFFPRASRLAMFGFLAFVLTASTATAQYCTPDQCDECNLCTCSQRCCHELPELWLINTRCAPRCRNLDNGFECLIYKRYDRRCCRWVRESRESFLAQEANKPTLFYAHGNSLNHKNAMKSCWQVYCKMRCCPGPKRLVFWSWPAERVFKTERLRVREMIKKNLRIKYVYAEYQGYYMAKLVNQMSLSQRVMMSGHSYGGITASAAMHYIGGGCLRGLTLEGGAAVERPNLRAAVISGAFDHDMLNPGNRYGQTFVAAEKVYVTRNIKDRTLKKWPKTSWRCKRAIGVLGVNANCLGVYRNKLCQQTMTADVGTSHYLTPHLKSVRFVAALCCLSFPECTGCSVPASTIQPAEPQIIPAEPDIAPPMTEDADVSSEAEFVIDDGFDLAVGDHSEFDDLELIVANELTPLDVAEVFGNEIMTEAKHLPNQSLAQQIACMNSDMAAMYIDLATPSLAPQGLTSPSLAALPLPAQPERRNDVQPAPQPSAEQTPEQLAENTADGSSRSVWYQLGLCLALVLSGQFYILFSKRAATS